MGFSKYSDIIKHYLGEQFNLPEDQVAVMLPEFKATLSQHIKNLEELLADDNLESLEKAGHTIKGAFLNLGLSECAELAMQIEQSASQQDTNVDYSAIVSQLRSVVTDIVNE